MTRLKELIALRMIDSGESSRLINLTTVSNVPLLFFYALRYANSGCHLSDPVVTKADSGPAATLAYEKLTLAPL